MGIGTQELLVILVIVFLLFGAKKLPELSSALGKSIRDFKKAAEEPPETREAASEKAEEKKA